MTAHAHHHHGAAEPAAHPSGTHQGHDKHAGHNIAMFRNRFWVSLLLTLPILALGHMLPGWLGYPPLQLRGGRWISAVLGVAVFVYGGWVFVRGAWGELKAGLPGMMTLIALAISVAFGFSLAVTLGFPGMPLWEELATLISIMLLGHWIEMRSIAQASGALKELTKLLPNTASRVTGSGADERIEEVTVADLKAGDVVLVRNDPRDVPRIIALSRASYRKMIQNLWWAVGYNVLAIPLAAGVLARWGIVLSPAVAAVLMSVSTVVVAANAQLLRRVRL